MTSQEIFTMLLVAVTMWIGGAVQLSRQQYALGSFMIAIPLIALVARVFGT
jgi:hypothetical protein